MGIKGGLRCRFCREFLNLVVRVVALAIEAVVAVDGDILLWKMLAAGSVSIKDAMERHPATKLIPRLLGKQKLEKLGAAHTCQRRGVAGKTRKNSFLHSLIVVMATLLKAHSTGTAQRPKPPAIPATVRTPSYLTQSPHTRYIASGSRRHGRLPRRHAWNPTLPSHWAASRLTCLVALRSSPGSNGVNMQWSKFIIDAISSLSPPMS
jgi:hypothetical protein